MKMNKPTRGARRAPQPDPEPGYQRPVLPGQNELPFDRPAGNALKTARVKAGLTQVQAALAAGVAQPDWSAYERGAKTPGLELWVRLCDVVNANPADVDARLAPRPSAGERTLHIIAHPDRWELATERDERTWKTVRPHYPLTPLTILGLVNEGYTITIEPASI